MKKIIFAFALFLFSFQSFAQSKAVEYDMPMLKGKYLIKDSANVSFFILMKLPNHAEQLENSFADNFRISWVVYPDYGVRERLASGAFVADKNNLFRNQNELYARIDANKIKANTGVFFAEITNVVSGKKELIDIPFDAKSPRLENTTTLFLENVPVPNFKNYFQKTERLLVKSVLDVQQDLFLVRYQHNFDSASPPTAITNSNIPRNIKIDSVSKIQSNQIFQVNTEGLYFITADTAKMNSGITFLCVDDHFPRLTRPEKLIKPLSYISTNQEINEFSNASIPKMALDDFFLKITSGNPIIAKQAIKSYFRRVATANDLFTTYKEGWKTDRGMVYIILGSPSSVQHSREREVWTYQQNQNFSEITFTFNKKTNQFTENHYELIRYPEYQAYWYPIVEAWRIGSIVE